MTKEKDLCPLNMTGDHRYFIFKTVEVFEPIESTIGRPSANGGTYYEKAEYALLGCNCGSVIKTKVKKQ